MNEIASLFANTYNEICTKQCTIKLIVKFGTNIFVL